MKHLTPLKRKFLLHLILVSVIVLPLSSRQWPDEPESVSGTFGTSRGGSFARGVEFRSEGQRVRSWGEGEVLWTSGPEDLWDSVPGDGLVVLEHPDGFRSSYRGIEARPDIGEIIDGSEWLGYAGTGSWEFVITDTKKSRIIDPITLLPAREKLNPPRLGLVEIVGGGERISVADNMVIPPGRWILSVDLAFAEYPGAIPAELSLFWVGERIGGLRFDSLEETDGRILMDAPEPLSYDAIYDEDGFLTFRDILLNAGRGILELRLRDESGRVITKSWNLSVRDS